MAVLILIGMYMIKQHMSNGPTLASQLNMKPGRELGIWEWRDVSSLGDYEQKLLLIKQQGFTTVYLNINQIADLNEEPQNKKTVEIEKFTLSIKMYISAAHRNGLKVQALAGDRDWATSDKRYLMSQVADYVVEFNEANAPAASFSGIQFDIEPYNLPNFPTDQQGVMSDYLESIKLFNSKWLGYENKTSSLSLGYALPFWLDGDNNYAEIMSWNNTKKYPTFHIIDELNNINKSYIVIMDYRNFAEGKDGSIEHAKGEFSYAKENKRKVRLIIGQETSYVEPSKITFFGLGADKMVSELELLQNNFGGNEAFEGFAIHDFHAYERMK